MKIKDQNIIHLSVDGELKKKLSEEATQKGLSLNAYVRMILIERNK